MEHKFLGGNRGTCVSKNLDETVRNLSKKRQESIQAIREKRLHATTKGTSSALRLASSSPASFPGRNEFSVTHYSLIVQKEREDSSCQRD